MCIVTDMSTDACFSAATRAGITIERPADERAGGRATRSLPPRMGHAMLAERARRHVGRILKFFVESRFTFGA